MRGRCRLVRTSLLCRTSIPWWLCRGAQICCCTPTVTQNGDVLLKLPSWERTDYSVIATQFVPRPSALWLSQIRASRYSRMGLNVTPLPLGGHCPQGRDSLWNRERSASSVPALGSLCTT